MLTGSCDPPAEHAAVISAVKAAAPELFVNARTDTYWLQTGAEPDRLRDTTGRLAAFRDAGADGVFTPGLTDLAELEQIISTIGLPLNVLWQLGVSLDDLGNAGVSRISTGSALYRHALAAALATATAAHTGTRPTTTAVDYLGLQRCATPSAAAVTR